MGRFKQLTAATAFAWILFSCGCVRMGMPESIAPLAGSMAADAATAILVVPDQNELPISPATVGYQFVFGIFPFTRLYLEHGIERFLEEAMYRVLVEQGYQVFTVVRSEVEPAIAILRPRLIVAAQFESLSLDAYDAMLFRILSLQGVLRVDRISASGKVAHSRIVNLSERSYRRSGHAPLLAAMLEKVVLQHLRDILQEERLGRRSRQVAYNRPVLLLQAPTHTVPFAKEYGALLADSYGFQGLPPYSKQELLRLIQHGIRAGTNVPVAIAAPPLSNGASFAAGALVLSSEVMKLDMIPLGIHPEKAGVALVLRFTLYERGRPLRAAVCRIFEPLERKRDGYWVVTVERAAANLASSFMNFRPLSEESGTYCQE